MAAQAEKDVNSSCLYVHLLLTGALSQIECNVGKAIKHLNLLLVPDRDNDTAVEKIIISTMLLLADALRSGEFRQDPDTSYFAWPADKAIPKIEKNPKAAYEIYQLVKQEEFSNVSANNALLDVEFIYHVALMYQSENSYEKAIEPLNFIIEQGDSEVRKEEVRTHNNVDISRERKRGLLFCLQRRTSLVSHIVNKACYERARTWANLLTKLSKDYKTGKTVNNPDLLFKLAKTYSDLKEYKTAFRLLHFAGSVQGKFYTEVFCFELAKNLIGVGNFTEAISLLKRIPEDAAARNYLAFSKVSPEKTMQCDSSIELLSRIDIINFITPLHREAADMGNLDSKKVLGWLAEEKGELETEENEIEHDQSCNGPAVLSS